MRCKLELVAEGVETEWDAQFLAAAGYDYAQGFRYSRALPADKCLAWIVEFNATAMLTARRNDRDHRAARTRRARSGDFASRRADGSVGKRDSRRPLSNRGLQCGTMQLSAAAPRRIPIWNPMSGVLLRFCRFSVTPNDTRQQSKRCRTPRLSWNLSASSSSRSVCSRLVDALARIALQVQLVRAVNCRSQPITIVGNDLRLMLRRHRFARVIHRGEIHVQRIAFAEPAHRYLHAVVRVPGGQQRARAVERYLHRGLHRHLPGPGSVDAAVAQPESRVEESRALRRVRAARLSRS